MQRFDSECATGPRVYKSRSLADLKGATERGHHKAKSDECKPNGSPPLAEIVLITIKILCNI